MVRPTQNASGQSAGALSPEIAAEKLRALTGLFDRMNDLMGGWAKQSKAAPDQSILELTAYYQTLCRDLDSRMAEFQRSVATADIPIDLSQLRKAREHIAIVLALNAANLLRAEQDVREGRTMSLEQMRRERRNPAH
jgi:hypothetical protein